LYEIQIMNLDSYINNYLRIPYDTVNKKFLYGPNDIPVASNGKIKDWENELTPPVYADLVAGSLNKIPYYTSNDPTIIWFNSYRFNWNKQEFIPDVFSTLDFVVYNWYENSPYYPVWAEK